MTYEERLQQLAELELAGRATDWSRADAWAGMVRDFGRKCLSDIASTLGKSTEYVRQHAIVAATFSGEHRHPDVDFSLYREITQAAKRSKGETTAVDLLRHVLDEGMSAAEVKLLYRSAEDKPPVLRFAARCKCGRRTIEYADVEDAGETVTCRKCDVVLGRLEV